MQQRRHPQYPSTDRQHGPVRSAVDVSNGAEVYLALSTGASTSYRADETWTEPDQVLMVVGDCDHEPSGDRGTGNSRQL